ncbi:MAG: hypothetical protein KDE19_09110 [Caldilineaceae bacterium]|nr:hypothetical protein [Caldilineaceae bacterium]
MTFVSSGDDLEQIYYLVAVASAAVESRNFHADQLDLHELLARQDDLGTLQHTLETLPHDEVRQRLPHALMTPSPEAFQGALASLAKVE